MCPGNSNHHDYNVIQEDEDKNGISMELRICTDCNCQWWVDIEDMQAEDDNAISQ